MNHETNTKTPERNRKPNYTLRRLGATGLALLVLAVGAKELKMLGVSPTYSNQTTEWTAGYNQGLNAAVAHIEGAKEFDNRALVYHVENMQQNKKVLANGLQQGEEVEIPVSVSP